MISRRTPTAISVLLLVPTIAATAADGPAEEKEVSWSIDARLAESCCCNPACPCLFGSPPTRGYCEGVRLVEIMKGHHGDVSLDKLSLVVAFKMGTWTKIYVSDKASEEQVPASKALLEKLGGFVFGKILEVKKVALSVTRKKSTLKFSTPDLTVEMEVLKGADGKPVRIANLPSFKGYTQYKSVTLEHKDRSEDRRFKYSGTNGFTSRYKKSVEKSVEKSGKK